MAMQQLRPTFSESWYRVADLKAKLRGSAQISRQFYRGDRWYVVRDPAGNQFHRLSASAYKFVGLLDGTRTVAEAWDLVGGQLADDAPTQNEVIQILTQLHAANLLETDITPDAQVLLRRYKKQQKKQWQGRMMNLMFPRIPLWDCDRFLVRWMPVMRPILSWLGALVWLAVVIGAVVTLLPHWDKLKHGASGAIDPGNWPALWATFVGIKLIHELGHAFACRRFGGEVHELGVMFLVFIPTPYVDASSAWSFPNKWARIFVGAGGMVFELFVAAIMAFVWLNTTGNPFLHHLAYNTMFIASVSTIIFNANPLLRYDGYYILSDWLEIPNLRYKATEYAMGLFKRHLFGVKSQQPLPPFGQRIWLFLYAVLSGAYRIFVGIAIILMVSDQVPVLGVLMAIGGIITWLFVPVYKILNYHLLNPELHRKRWRAAAWTTAIVASIVVAVGFIPFTPHFEVSGILKPSAREPLKIAVAGTVGRVVARDGQDVKPGDVILECYEPKIEHKILDLTHRLAAMQARVEWAQYNDPGQFEILQPSVANLQSQLKDAEDEKAKLTVRATTAGRLVAPGLRGFEGKYVQKGEDLGQVVDWRVLELPALADKSDEALVYSQSHKQAEVRVAGDIATVAIAHFEMDPVHKTARRATPTDNADHPSNTFAGGGAVASDPRDPQGMKLEQPMIIIPIILDNADGKYLPGQRAHVRFDLDKKPLVWQWKRRFLQVLQQHSHGKWL